ncbi:MAG TPA: hypothetical protein VGS22_00965 [Thermoanaerobaculia bacterium]|jgi:hypothetical protein|nr:hypothetical protein [Thermoanaerobaculia bacterium]
MRVPKSFADILRDWELLLEAANDNEEALSPAVPVRAALAEALTQVRALKARQDSHGANRQQMTQELADLIFSGKELARRLRGLTKGLLGTRTERLVQFNVTPIRPRTRSRRNTPPSDTSPPSDTAVKTERKSAVGD